MSVASVKKIAKKNNQEYCTKFNGYISNHISVWTGWSHMSPVTELFLKNLFVRTSIKFVVLVEIVKILWINLRILSSYDGAGVTYHQTRIIFEISFCTKFKVSCTKLNEQIAVDTEVYHQYPICNWNIFCIKLYEIQFTRYKIPDYDFVWVGGL